MLIGLVKSQTLTSIKTSIIARKTPIGRNPISKNSFAITVIAEQINGNADARSYFHKFSKNHNFPRLQPGTIKGCFDHQRLSAGRKEDLPHEGPGVVINIVDNTVISTRLFLPAAIVSWANKSILSLSEDIHPVTFTAAETGIHEEFRIICQLVDLTFIIVKLKNGFGDWVVSSNTNLINKNKKSRLVQGRDFLCLEDVAGEGSLGC